MAFIQAPPALGNQFEQDALLRSYLSRVLPDDVEGEIRPSLEAMGDLAGNALYELQQADRLNEPVLEQWDPWGERIDRILLTPLWQRAERIAAEQGVVATAYERKHGRFSRVHQFALAYLFGPSSDVYSCPLAMTDGAAKTLLRSGNQTLIDRAVPHLLSRDPATFWTSGQWMTESTGGSDVGTSETIAVADGDGLFSLHGRKWFTSAATSQMALTLARPEGNGPGGRGLALFFIETRDADGRLRNIRIDRLKEKLGTRKLPTAELTLDGTPAELVLGDRDGVRNITTMLNITRTWNAVMSVGGMRRGVALARDYAQRRRAFGASLSEKSLHLDTLADLEAELSAAFHLSFFIVELLGREECGELDESGQRLLRLVTPIAKLMTAKQAVAVASEVLECIGGAAYVEDTGLPMLLRDAQTLPIWEGTTNVLSLDTLRALAKEGGLDDLSAELDRCTASIEDRSLLPVAERARAALGHASSWLLATMESDPLSVEAGARRFALTLGRSLALGLMLRHAAWAHGKGDPRPAAAARRYGAGAIDLVGDRDREDSRVLAL